MEQYGAFSTLYDVLMEDVDYDRWAGFVAELMERYRPDRQELRVLDCASGTGSVAIRLAKKGYRVTGADISEDMLRIAMEKARLSGVAIPFVHMDMRSVAIHKKQDVITCCCDGVNYLTSSEDVKAFFNSARENLIVGGLLLFDVSSRYKLSEVIGCRQMGEDRAECTYLWENVYDPESVLIEMDLHFFVRENNGKLWRRFDEKHLQRAHSESELRQWATECGYEVLQVLDFDTKGPVRDITERLQFVLRRI